MCSKLVFIRPGALGDTLLALPAVAQARHRWPDADITLVAREDVGRLALAAGMVDHQAAYGDAGWSALFRDQSPRVSSHDDELYPLLNGSAVVAWLLDEEGAVARNLFRLGAETIVLRSGRPSLEVVEHMSVTLAQSLLPLGLNTTVSYPVLAAATPLFPPLWENADERQGQRNQLWNVFTPGRPTLAFHAGSGGEAKRWPPELFARLIETSVAHGFSPLLITGPQDHDCSRLISSSCVPAARAHLASVHDLSLPELSQLLQYCVAYIGNDSGMTHLAALSGVPTVALFGPSSPDYWAPVGRQVHIVRSSTGDMCDISYQTAWEALVGLFVGGRR